MNILKTDNLKSQFATSNLISQIVISKLVNFWYTKRINMPRGEGSEPTAENSYSDFRFPPDSAKQNTEKFDKKYWTSERIGLTVANFFKKLEQNEQKMKAERKILLENALKQEEAIRRAEREITEKFAQSEEIGRSEKFRDDILKSEAERQFRSTLEWMVEQSQGQTQDLALNFLNSQKPQD